MPTAIVFCYLLKHIPWKHNIKSQGHPPITYITLIIQDFHRAFFFLRQNSPSIISIKISIQNNNQGRKKEPQPPSKRKTTKTELKIFYNEQNDKRRR
jgi:hypothetical protein